ncbi:MAG: hypothetical protein EBQ96_03360 [Proteobacteria bacterium]|nr:hypothetical protein [Pseudomonadota bacterium]
MNHKERLEALIEGVEKAEADVKAGKRVDMKMLDKESITLHKELKAKPDPALQPTLMRAISALERLTATLEQHVANLKSGRQ